MGRHSDAGRRRGIASWPLVAAAVVVVLAGVAVLYVFVLDKGDDRADQTCTGSAVLTVVASAGASPAARALSDAYNATGPISRGTCMTSSVVTVASGDAAGLLGDGWAGREDPVPAVWVTDDAGQLATLEQRAPTITAGRDTDPLATSPVVLAVRSDAQQVWGTAPSWTRLPAAMRGGSDGARTLLTPDPRDSRATIYALDSMFAVDGSAPTGDEIAGAGGSASALVDRSSTALATTGDALQQLADASSPNTAVPVTEAELAAFNSSAQQPLTAMYPTGPTAGDEVFVIGLTMDGVDETQRDAATRFHAFARDAAGQQIFNAARLRTPGLTPADVPGLDFTTSTTMLATSTPDSVQAWARALGLPADGSGSSTPGTGSSSVPVTTPPSTTAPSTTAPSTTPPSTTAPSTTPPSTTAPSTTPPTSRSSSGLPPVSSTSTGPPTTVQSTTSGSSSSRPGSASSSSTPASSGTGVTFLVDTSATWDTVVRGRSRISWVQEALTSGADAAGGRRIGLWTTSSVSGTDGYAEVVPLGAVSATTRTGIEQLSASGSRRYYAALPQALQSLAEVASADAPQRLVLITDGPDQTTSTPRAGVLAAVRDVVAGNHVTLDVVGVGENAPDTALAEL
ncbi:MAG: VWA domain-containing protein, partial [Williamsia herbipolensis]|nr:VWA domain-containing protein [Williamsia herbipolensis]